MAIQTLFKNEICEWIDVETPDTADIQHLIEKYAINKLLLDDTMEPNHLPKFEEQGNVKFFLTREYTETDRHNLNTISDISTKLSVFILKDVIITIHRIKNNSIYEYKRELSKTKEQITPDRIALNLALKVIKSYDDENKKLLDKMDRLENEIFLKNTRSSHMIRRLYKVKRKAALSSRLLNISGEWVRNFTTLNLAESEITDLVDSYKDVIADFEHLNSQAANLIAMFLAFSDQKANQVMKLLAIYSVYFLPITFLAGVYGMNFGYMPELTQKYGYFIILGVMTLIVISTFIYFKRKKW
ncbi:magnesium transporter CorA [Crocinitomicaceae bacterium CZZ-1]|uniref:Magnesium transporter CorA n=1 Tax=Taishania pollutisoli TaxID=2766479 RepID=A0A8J6TYC4_9FLAO|nr:CorA family divalent cation transporter [Taishania pollutisoli]MBC9813901.1 magnesium transporter CorA [Taishania pollutisoli]MBX2948691.1 magnesium transporter CorA [Crocinitomicaceae bacterium]